MAISHTLFYQEYYIIRYIAVFSWPCCVKWKHWFQFYRHVTFNVKILPYLPHSHTHAHVLHTYTNTYTRYTERERETRTRYNLKFLSGRTFDRKNPQLVNSFSEIYPVVISRLTRSCCIIVDLRSFWVFRHLCNTSIIITVTMWCEKHEQYFICKVYMCYLIYFTITCSNDVITHSGTHNDRRFVKCTLSTCTYTSMYIFNMTYGVSYICEQN